MQRNREHVFASIQIFQDINYIELSALAPNEFSGRMRIAQLQKRHEVVTMMASKHNGPCQSGIDQSHSLFLNQVSNMNFAIVVANLNSACHAEGIVAVLDSYASEPMGSGAQLRADVREKLIDELRRHPTTKIWIAENEDGQAIGVAVCFLGFSTFAAQPLINIHDLAVLPQHRGIGVGAALLEAVEHSARELGCCKVTLEVRADNRRARSLYIRSGFGDFSPGEQPVETIFMEKKLSPMAT